MGEDFMPRRLAQIEREGELDRADTWQCHGVEWFAGDQCLGCEAAQVERERIIKWIEDNRSAIEIEPGENIYRDHFNSQSLIAFIKGENK